MQYDRECTSFKLETKELGASRGVCSPPGTATSSEGRESKEFSAMNSIKFA